MAKAYTISVENNLSSPSLSFSTAACHWRHISLWLVSDCRLPAASHKLQACIKIPDASQVIGGHSLCRKMGMDVVNVVVNGLYKVKDGYFEAFKTYASSKQGGFCDNKKEKRPYCCASDGADGVIWMVPLSTRVAKYKNKIQKYKDKGRDCVFYTTGLVGNIDNAFLIGDIFPVSEKYIFGEYFKFGAHYVIQNRDLLKELHRKAAKYIALVRRGLLYPCVDILGIENELKRQIRETKT